LTAERPTFNPHVAKRRLIVVVLGTPSAVKRAEVAHKLMDLAYTYTRDEEVIPKQRLIAELPVIKSTLKMFKVETKQPTIVTTSLYDQATPIDLNSFDLLTQRIHLVDANQQVSTVEPLQTTNTHIHIELNEQHLTAPLTQVMNLATVSIYQNNQLIRSLQIENDVQIEGASSNFVEQGLPDMGQVLVNQCDSGFLFPAKTFTQLCRKFQTTCATAYNHDMM
jgi:serine-type D-Ala-D-Ala carboxypeptidase (penicillin-binding protein 5/6)